MAFQVNCEEIFFIDWKWTIYSYNKALFNRKYDWHLLYHTGVPRNHSNVVILFPELCISKIPQSGICPAPCAYLGHVALLSSKAKLNNKIILVDTLSPVYIQVYCISHVVFICFMSSLFALFRLNVLMSVIPCDVARICFSQQQQLCTELQGCACTLHFARPKFRSWQMFL